MQPLGRFNKACVITRVGPKLKLTRVKIFFTIDFNSS